MQTAFLQEQECVQAANARSEAVEQAHFDSALSDCSAVLLENDSAPAVVPAGPPAVGLMPACSAPADWVVLMDPGSVPADYSALVDRGVRLYFLDARPEYSLLAERRLDSVEDCKEFLPLWLV